MRLIKEILSETTSLILDTSILLCYFMDEIQDVNSLLDNHVFTSNSNITLYGHNLIKTELFYITCRLKGSEDAEHLVRKLESIMNTINDNWLYRKAASIKCKFPIAISDCYSIALAILQDCPVFFLPEQELKAEMIKDISMAFNAKIYLIKL